MNGPSHIAVASALATAAVLCAARPAAANSRYPAANQILAPQTFRADPNLVLTRTTFGVLVSQDTGGTWRWLCESALGVPAVSVEDPWLGLTAGDALVVGLYEGLEVSTDNGCNFGCIGGPLAGQPIVDIVVRPDAPHVVLALKSSYVFGDGGSDAGPTLDTEVFESTDDGATWAPVGSPLDPTLVVTTIEVAASDPGRLYVSATRGFGATRTAWLLVSTDAGATWTERPVPLDPATEVSVYIGGVDPLVADRVYLRSSGQSATRLFVTSDAGQSFSTPLTLVGPMLGFALSPDGSKVYAGGQEDGLHVGTTGDAGLAFRQTSSIPIQCLASAGSTLWACSDDQPGRFVVGVSDDDGATFTAKLHSTGLSGPVACRAAAQGSPLACGADANASQCGGETFAAICSTLGGCLGDGGDAAAVDPKDASSTEAVVVPTAGSACRCSLPGGDTGTGGEVAVTSGMVAAFASRRRRRRRD